MTSKEKEEKAILEQIDLYRLGMHELLKIKHLDISYISIAYAINSVYR